MATLVTMPKLGLTMNSGSVQQWNKKIGDSVSKGELLFTVATDKLTVDVESVADGVLLEIVVEIGQDVPVGATLAYIGQPGEKIDGAVAPAQAAEAAPAPQATAAAQGAPQAAPQPAAAPGSAQAPAAAKSGRVPSSPKAKKLAREKGVDLNSLSGTGPMGWVVARDVLAAAEGGARLSPTAAKMAEAAGVDPASLAGAGRVMKADVAQAAAGAQTGERRIPITQMRRVIGQRMLQSVASIPSVNFFADADMGKLAALRASLNERLGKTRPGTRISVNDLLMKLCAKLLLENPMLNAYVEPDSFVLHDYVNIGFAVALPGGLLVPVIKNVQSKSLTQIALERAELVEKARSGALAPDEMSGGTFTISNLGMMGIDGFTPIINLPEAAILGVGSTQEKAVVRNGEIVARPMANLCLTADHRLADGADAARFLAALKDLVENPDFFLL